MAAPAGVRYTSGVDEAYVGLGGNQGEVEETIRRAAASIAALPFVAGVRLSSLYRTDPVGPIGATEQPRFVNACVGVRFGALAPSPVALLAALLGVEAALGRDRRVDRPGGPRAIDLDLLVWGERVVDEAGPPSLVLPHARLTGRAFALVPLAELAGPDLVVPGPGGGRVGVFLASLRSDPAQAIARIVYSAR